MAEKKTRRPGATGGAQAGVQVSQQSCHKSPPKSTPQARWAARNPKAKWAHVALQSALRRGLIEREPCVFCGDEKSEGHHPDYNRPMDVVWVCRRHHKAIHARMRGRG